MNDLRKIYDKITCNENREMTFERFEQAVKEIETMSPFKWFILGYIVGALFVFLLFAIS